MIGPYNLIVSNGVLQNSSDVFGILDPDTGGARTFSVKLNATGLAADPVTHWGCRTMLEDSTVNALQNMTTTQFQTYVNSLATSRGRTQLASSVAFKNNVQMDSTKPFTEFATSLGLKKVEEAIG